MSASPLEDKDKFNAALKTADEVPLSKPPTAGADEVPLSPEPIDIPSSFTESVEAHMERIMQEAVDQGYMTPQVRDIITRPYRGKGKKPPKK